MAQYVALHTILALLRCGARRHTPCHVTMLVILGSMHALHKHDSHVFPRCRPTLLSPVILLCVLQQLGTELTKVQGGNPSVSSANLCLCYAYVCERAPPRSCMLVSFLMSSPTTHPSQNRELKLRWLYSALVKLQTGREGERAGEQRFLA